MEINNTIKHIFEEGLIDAEIGMSDGNPKAFAFHDKVSNFLRLGEIPSSEIGFLFYYYTNLAKDLLQQEENIVLDELRSEVNYMLNYMSSIYSFEEVVNKQDTVLIVRKKGEDK